MSGVLFEDIFDVKDIDPDGKKFDRGKLNIQRTKSAKNEFSVVLQFVVRRVFLVGHVWIHGQRHVVY